MIAIKPDRNPPRMLTDSTDGLHPTFTASYLRKTMSFPIKAFFVIFKVNKKSATYTFSNGMDAGGVYFEYVDAISDAQEFAAADPEHAYVVMSPSEGYTMSDPTLVAVNVVVPA
jgi:hypothetical protein